MDGMSVVYVKLVCVVGILVVLVLKKSYFEGLLSTKCPYIMCVHVQKKK